jgi:hypothetical protein
MLLCTRSYPSVVTNLALTAGLPVLSPPSLPADLNEGYPDSFIRKPAGDTVSVEVIVNAAVHAGTALQGISVVTFRNVGPLDSLGAWLGCLTGSCLARFNTI